MVEPTSRLNLDMLADCVKSEILCKLNIPRQSLVGWSSVESVRPPALIERTIHKYSLAIEGCTKVTILVALLAELTHCSVRLNALHNLAVLLQGNLQVVEVRSLRSPPLSIRDVNLCRGTCRSCALSYLCTVVEHLNCYYAILNGSLGCYDDIVVAEVACREYAYDVVLLRYRLQPYSLPDTRNRGVPNLAKLGQLLTYRLLTLLGWVPYANNQLLCALLVECRSDIEREWGETAGVTTYEYAVNIYIGSPIYCAEVEHHAL